MTESPAYGAPEFDWSILERPSAHAMLLGQLEFSWLELRARLRTFSAPGTLGTGAWVAEWPGGADAPTPRTIAWLVAHLTEGFLERWDWTFGEHRLRRTDLDVAGEVGPAVAQLERWVDAWRAGVAGLAEDDVLTVGLSTATPVDARAPFGHLVLHMNRELVHHGAEIMALTDLYRATHAGADA